GHEKKHEAEDGWRHDNIRGHRRCEDGSAEPEAPQYPVEDHARAGSYRSKEPDRACPHRERDAPEDPADEEREDPERPKTYVCGCVMRWRKRFPVTVEN